MITLDYDNCLTDRVGAHGVEKSALESAAGRLAELAERLESSRGTGDERWRDLPHDPMRTAHVTAVRSIADDLRPGTENLVVLGIGGSALGNIALQAALNPSTWNLLPRDQRDGPRLFVLDNVDPHIVGQTIDEVRRGDPGLERTVVNVISKSGETAETAAQFLIFRDLLESTLGPRYAERIVAITDPEKGTMRTICDEAGIRTLPVPDGVGGRFSVLSPVGLFSAAMCGIDIDELLDGAAAMDARCGPGDDPLRNPAAVLAWMLMTMTAQGKSIHVLMPYANQLYLMADWFRQLWAESLGKREDRSGREVFAGATPVKALGATDQHSQVQLYREGPNDKVIGFVEVDDFARDVTVPATHVHDRLDYLGGRTLNDLLAAEKRATEYALTVSERPNYTLRLPRLDAHHVGGFIQLWEVTTAFAGAILDINAYDQPAVETGKVATFGLMGRDGYGEWKDRVDGLLGRA